MDARPSERCLATAAAPRGVAFHLAIVAMLNIEEELRGRGAILSTNRPTTDNDVHFATADS
jgi:hypothetical protein